MNYKDALSYIHSVDKMGSILGLDIIRALLSYLGSPEKDLKIIHIAGTNGKGSTASYIANTLTTAGYKTGKYISPFVDQFNERIQIDSCYISNDEIGEYTGIVKSAIEKMVTDGIRHPTEFEVITAVALLYFQHQQCEYVVLETGLGGRLDATNVVEKPILTVITSIGIDHTQILGDTLEKIAYEKAGIIKENVDLVLYPLQTKGVFKVIAHVAASKGVKTMIPNIEKLEISNLELDSNQFTYKNYHISLLLRGEYQIYNAITAIEALEILAKTAKITECDIAKGISTTVFAGRFEKIAVCPTIYIDGAHNFSGMSGLCNTLEYGLKGKKIIVVMGMLQDKEYDKCVEIIAPYVGKFVALRPDNERALEPKALCACAKKYVSDAVYFDDTSEGIDYLLKNAKEDDIIIICGSLYLIGNIRKMIVERKTK